MFVKNRMTADPVTIPSDATVSFAAMEMRRRKVRHFPVTDDALSRQKLVGLVSIYDIARAFPDHLNPFSVEVFEDTVPRKIHAIMTKKVITISPDCPIEEAAEILRKYKINALPVLRDNHLVGIITSSDIFDSLVSMTAAKSNGVRVVIESQNEGNPIFSIVETIREHQLKVLSMVTYQEGSTGGIHTSIIRFGGLVPGEFFEDLSKHRLRVMSVGTIGGQSSVPANSNIGREENQATTSACPSEVDNDFWLRPRL